jgi:hypothetical protein
MAAAIHGHSGRPRNIANGSVAVGSGTGALVAGGGVGTGAMVWGGACTGGAVSWGVWTTLALGAGRATFVAGAARRGSSWAVLVGVLVGVAVFGGRAGDACVGAGTGV